MAASLNEVSLMGNVTRDPEVKYTTGGTAISEVGLAVNKTWTDRDGRKQEEVTFLNITFWGRQAEIAGEYLKKGSPIYVRGHLKLDSWDDRDTGKKRYALKIVGERMQMLGRRGDGGQQQGDRYQGDRRPDSRGNYTPRPEDDPGGYSDGGYSGATDPFNEDEVPF